MTKKSLMVGTAILLGIGPFHSLARATERGPTHSLHSQGPSARAETVLLADNVVVTPTESPAPPPSVPAQTVPVQAPVAAPQQTVVETPRTSKVVHADVEGSHNYMSTLAVSALMGAVVGVLVGGSIYYLGDQTHARNIAYWGAGGVLLGVGVGVTQIAVQESRISNATALDKLPSDPAPTFRLALLSTTF